MLRKELKRLRSNTFIILALIILQCVLMLYIGSIAMSDGNKAYAENYAQYLKTGEAYTPSIQPSNELFDQIDTLETQGSRNQKNAKAATEKLELPIFINEYTKKVAKEESEVLSTIANQPVSVVSSYVASKVFTSSVLGVLGFAFTSILVYFIYLQDITSGMMSLFKTTKGGLTKTYVTKTLVFLISIILFVIISDMIIAIGLKLSGLDLNASIQSVYQFNQYPYALTVLEYLAFISIQQILALFFISQLILLITYGVKNMALALGIVAALIMFSALTSMFLPISSKFAIIKYINLFTIITNTDTSYTIMKLGPFVQEVTIFMIGFSMVGCVIGVIANYTYNYKVQEFKAKQLGFNVSLKSTSLPLGELFQIGILQKSLLIILVVFSYSAYKYKTFSVPENKFLSEEGESIRQSYMGEITEEKLAQLDYELNDKKAAYDDLIRCLETSCVENGEMTYLDQLNLEDRARNYYVYQEISDSISQVLSQGGTLHIDDEPYKFMIGDKSTIPVIINLLVVILSVSLVVASGTAQIYETKLNQLYETTKKGGKRKRQIDLVIYIIIAIAIVLVVNGLFFLKFKKGYEVLNNNYPLNVLVNTSSDMGIYTYLFIYISYSILLALTVVHGSYKLSKRLDASIVVAIVGTVAMLNCLVFSKAPLFTIFAPLSVDSASKSIFIILCFFILICANILMLLPNLVRNNQRL